VYNYRKDEYLKKIESKIIKKETEALNLPFLCDEYFYLKIVYYLKLATTVYFIRMLVEETKQKKMSEDELGTSLIN
jgi:hypothetical protein